MCVCVRERKEGARDRKWKKQSRHRNTVGTLQNFLENIHTTIPILFINKLF